MEITGELSCHDWGKCGKKSIAGVCYWALRKRNLLNENTNYSTLIFSANDSIRPTYISTKETLNNFIKKNADVLGKHGQLYGNHLPFQIKILSIRKSMSLSCHPNKEHAQRLHRQYPRRYMFDVHKPKLVISLNYVEVMAGFRQHSEIASFISGVPELGIVIPYQIVEDYRCTGLESHLKKMFYHLLNASHEEIKLSLDIFFARMKNADSKAKDVVNYNVLKRLFDQFSYDTGVYAPLFLNHIVLNPGQALFIPSGTVHNYLEGDCLEVTTHSRNIIRCGLTNKFKDIQEFLITAEFKPCSVETMFYQPIVEDLYLTSFIPPAKEFQVSRICVPEELSYTLEERESCSIAVVLRGSAVLDDFRVISMGTSLFILPYQKLTFKVKNDITVYVVFPNHLSDADSDMY